MQSWVGFLLDSEDPDCASIGQNVSPWAGSGGACAAGWLGRPLALAVCALVQVSVNPTTHS